MEQIKTPKINRIGSRRIDKEDVADGDFLERLGSQVDKITTLTSLQYQGVTLHWFGHVERGSKGIRIPAKSVDELLELAPAVLTVFANGNETVLDVLMHALECIKLSLKTADEENNSVVTTKIVLSPEVIEVFAEVSTSEQGALLYLFIGVGEGVAVLNRVIAKDLACAESLH